METFVIVDVCISENAKIAEQKGLQEHVGTSSFAERGFDALLHTIA